MVTIGGGRVLCPKQLGPGQLDPRAQLSGAQLSTPKKVDSWAQDRCAPDSWVPWPNCPGPRTGGRGGDGYLCGPQKSKPVVRSRSLESP